MTTEAPDLVDFDKLKPYKIRHFVPEVVDLKELNEIEALYQKLLDREISSVADLEQWIFDRSELEAAVDQQGSVLYIRMTCQTDDPARAQAYKDFIETIVPAIKPLEDKLNKMFLSEIEKYSLDSTRYEVYTKKIKSDVDLFVEANVALQTEVSLLSQEYQTLCGAMTVDFKGEEHTLPQMSKYLLEPDRELRESAWRAISQRRLQDKEKLENIFDKMITLRHKIATNAQCQNFCEYKFRSLHRFDYTPDDCKKYHQTIEEVVVPVWNVIAQKRIDDMKIDSLRPWDKAVDPLGRDSLKPFTNVQELIEGCQKIFNQVDDILGKQFLQMSQKGLLDLASRKGKAPGGYQSSLDEAREPFIFMNAVGIDDDVRTLLHEAGHAFHSCASRDQSLVDYRHGPMEFNEVASMGMELLAGEYISAFYNSSDEQRSRTSHLEGVVFVLIWVATIDAFQHWLYENPSHTQEQRKAAWLDVRKRFGMDATDWDGLEEEHAYLWHRQLHIFEVPFYYIEYGIAQLGALQLWHSAKKDWTTAIKNYRQALSLGGSRPLPELFQTAGIRFDFSKETIAPLIEAAKEELGL